MPRQSKKNARDTSTDTRLPDDLVSYLNNKMCEVIELLKSVSRSLDCEMSADAYRNLNGMLYSAFLRIAQTALPLDTIGRRAMRDIPTKKRKRASIARGNSAARRPARTSTRSTRKRAKPARTGKRSKARSFSDVILPKVKYKATPYKRPPRP